jgi:hypothetical protein
MQCSRQQENRESGKFCNECAAPLLLPEEARRTQGLELRIRVGLNAMRTRLQAAVARGLTRSVGRDHGPRNAHTLSLRNKGGQRGRFNYHR